MKWSVREINEPPTAAAVEDVIPYPGVSRTGGKRWPWASLKASVVEDWQPSLYVGERLVANFLHLTMIVISLLEICPPLAPAGRHQVRQPHQKTVQFFCSGQLNETPLGKRGFLTCRADLPDLVVQKQAPVPPAQASIPCNHPEQIPIATRQVTRLVTGLQ